MDYYYTPNFDNEIVRTTHGVASWFTNGGPAGVFVFIKILVAIFSLGLLFTIVYAYIGELEVGLKIKDIKKNWKKEINIETKKKNFRYDMILQNLASDNEASWRLAIIEADLILDEMLAKLVPHGGTIADRLKMVTKREIANLDSAWEAHKVRNRIAHDGSAFHITRPEARRVIGLYEAVFYEFGVI